MVISPLDEFGMLEMVAELEGTTNPLFIMSIQRVLEQRGKILSITFQSFNGSFHHLPS